jgi:hypothetical protein
MNDETLKEEIDTWIRQAYVNGSLDVNNPEPQGSDVCTELVWEAVLKDRERVVREAKSKGHWYMHDSFNYDSGYIAHCVCGYSSGEEDVIKGHVRWEIAKLSNLTQEKESSENSN